MHDSLPFLREALQQDMTEVVRSLRKRMQTREIEARAYAGWSISTPGMPSSGIETLNTNTKPVTIYLKGAGISLVQIKGTFSDGSVGSVTVSILEGTFRLNPGDSIIVTWSTFTPSWLWYGD